VAVCGTLSIGQLFLNFRIKMGLGTGWWGNRLAAQH